jgi:hypothetical protein
MTKWLYKPHSIIPEKTEDCDGPYRTPNKIETGDGPYRIPDKPPGPSWWQRHKQQARTVLVIGSLSIAAIALGAQAPSCEEERASEEAYHQSECTTKCENLTLRYF